MKPASAIRFAVPAICLAALLGIVPTRAWAGDGPEAPAASCGVPVGVPISKVAFVDFDRVVAESRSIASTFAELSVRMGGDSGAIEDAQQEIADMRSSLELQATLLTPEARAERWNALMERADAVDRQAADHERKLDACRGQLDALTARINDAVGTVAERENISIVLRGENVFYGSESADMTPLVVAYLDTQTSAPIELSSATQPSGTEVPGAAIASRPAEEVPFE